MLADTQKEAIVKAAWDYPLNDNAKPFFEYRYNNFENPKLGAPLYAVNPTLNFQNIFGSAQDMSNVIQTVLQNLTIAKENTMEAEKLVRMELATRVCAQWKKWRSDQEHPMPAYMQLQLKSDERAKQAVFTESAIFDVILYGGKTSMQPMEKEKREIMWTKIKSNNFATTQEEITIRTNSTTLAEKLKAEDWDVIDLPKEDLPKEATPEVIAEAENAAKEAAKAAVLKFLRENAESAKIVIDLGNSDTSKKTRPEEVRKIQNEYIQSAETAALAAEQKVYEKNNMKYPKNLNKNPIHTPPNQGIIEAFEEYQQRDVRGDKPENSGTQPAQAHTEIFNAVKKAATDFLKNDKNGVTLDTKSEEVQFKKVGFSFTNLTGTNEKEFNQVCKKTADDVVVAKGLKLDEGAVTKAIDEGKKAALSDFKASQQEMKTVLPFNVNLPT